MENKNWIKSLIQHLRNILNIVIDVKTIKKITNEKTWQNWALAFIIDGYGKEYDNQKYKFVGDNVMNTMFSIYIYDKFPNMTKENFTRLKSEYFGSINQSNIGYILKFDQYLILKSPNTLTRNLIKTCTHNFFGMLAILPASFGINGIEICRRILMVFFEKMTFSNLDDINLTNSDIEQIFKKLGIGKIEKINENKISSTKITINLSQQQFDYFNNRAMLGIKPFQIKTLAVYECPTHVEAEYNAPILAFEKLKEHGVTPKKAFELKQLDDAKQIPRISEAITTLNKKGYVKIYFIEPRKTTTSDFVGGKTQSLLQLIGVDKNNNKTVIKSILMKNKNEIIFYKSELIKDLIN